MELEKFSEIKKQIEVLTPAKDVIQKLVNDYSQLVVNQDTLPDVRNAYSVVHDKRVELTEIRKNGTSQFENIKKQFQTNCDTLINMVVPVENKLKSEINTFDDEDAWKKTEKENTEKAYTAYLKKFNDAKFDYIGKYVNRAKVKLEEFEEKRRKQTQNFIEFNQRCNNLFAYKTSESAKQGKEKLLIMDITEDVFGDKSAEAFIVRANTLALFDVRIAELKQAEELSAERERLDRLTTKVNQFKNYFSTKISDADLKNIDSVIDEIKMLITSTEEFAERSTDAETEKRQLLAIAEYKKTNLIQTAEFEKQKAEMEADKIKMEADKKALQEQQEAIAQENARLAEIKEQKEKEAAEAERKAELLEQGLVEIGNGTVKIEIIQSIADYFKRQDAMQLFNNDYRIFERLNKEMQEGKDAGKQFFNDLTTVQRQNEAIRAKVFEKLDTLITELINYDLLTSAQLEGIITGADLINHFSKSINATYIK